MRRVPERAPQAQPPASVPSSAGGPRAVPCLLLRPGPSAGASRSRWGLHGSRLLVSGEAAGGACNAILHLFAAEARVLTEPGEGAKAGRGRVRWHVEGTGSGPWLQRCAGGAGDVASDSRAGLGQGAADWGSLGRSRQGQPLLRCFQAAQKALGGSLRARSSTASLSPSFPPGLPREGAPGAARLGERGGGGGGRGREGVRPERRELLVRGRRLLGGGCVCVGGAEVAPPRHH